MTFMSIPIDPDTQHQLNGGKLLTDSLPEKYEVTIVSKRFIDMNSTIVLVTFAVTDLNEIKRQDMCTRNLGVLDCFLVYRSGAIIIWPSQPRASALGAGYSRLEPLWTGTVSRPTSTLQCAPCSWVGLMNKTAHAH